LDFHTKKTHSEKQHTKKNMNVIPLMCISTLFVLGSAEGRGKFSTFFELLSFLSLHAFLPCFPWFQKTAFFAVFISPQNHHF